MSQPQLDQLLQRLWEDFTKINPQAEKIHQLLEARGETVINDHIAFRTLADPRIGMDVIARPFVNCGYTAKGQYHFEQKHLDARHYEHADPNLPKVFISELRLQDFSAALRSTMDRLLDQISPDAIRDPQLCAAGRLWNLSYAEYTALAEESEYAGWLAAFGFCANHFTVFVNALKSIRSLSELNDLIKAAGFPLNAEGGEIKGSPDVFLEQSSTLASQVDIRFADGVHRIPGCYYEFARRYHLPDGTLFNGFVTTSADKIFHSTDRRT